MLAKHDYIFKSDTDSEVLAALIDLLYKDADSLLEAVSGALKMVVGAYGIAPLALKTRMRLLLRVRVVR